MVDYAGQIRSPYGAFKRSPMGARDPGAGILVSILIAIDESSIYHQPHNLLNGGLSLKSDLERIEQIAVDRGDVVNSKGEKFLPSGMANVRIRVLHMAKPPGEPGHVNGGTHQRIYPPYNAAPYFPSYLGDRWFVGRILSYDLLEQFHGGGAFVGLHSFVFMIDDSGSFGGYGTFAPNVDRVDEWAQEKREAYPDLITHNHLAQYPFIQGTSEAFIRIAGSALFTLSQEWESS